LRGHLAIRQDVLAAAECVPMCTYVYLCVRACGGTDVTRPSIAKWRPGETGHSRKSVVRGLLRHSGKFVFSSTDQYAGGLVKALSPSQLTFASD
jgi:hypothetical protein